MLARLPLRDLVAAQVLESLSRVGADVEPGRAGNVVLGGDDEVRCWPGAHELARRPGAS